MSTFTTTSFPECCTAACCDRRQWARRSRRSTSRRSPACPAFASFASPTSSASSPATSGPPCARHASSRSAGATSAALIGHDAVVDWARSGPFVAEEVIAAKGDAQRIAALASVGDAIRATYSWPIQSHGSIGPSCAVADVRADGGTVWTASQASHRFLATFAALVELPREKLRVIYLDGAGCYGMNGHDDAAADAVLLSKAVGKPVRVQWSREDELGWDPKGPPQLLELRATLTADGRIDAWETEMWVPRATANLEWVPLLAPLAAGMRQPVGQSVGLVSQNGDPPYAANAVKVSAHWLGPAPLRPSNIRAPGKVANCFAVESFVDELAAKAQARPAGVSPARPRRIRAAPRCCGAWRS